MTLHPILIECVEDERPDAFLCRIAGEKPLFPMNVWIPKVAIRSAFPFAVGECDVKAEIPRQLAYQLGLVKEFTVVEDNRVLTTCHDCPAKVFWGRSVNGKPMIIDAEPVEYGGTIVLRDGVAVVLKKDEPSLPGEKRYKSHWATCPAAANFRKPASTDAAKTKTGKRSTRKPAKTEPNLFGEE